MNQVQHQQFLDRYQDRTDRRLGNIKRTFLKDLLHNHFDSPGIQEEMEHIVNSALRRNTSSAEMSRFFNQIQVLSVKSAEGVVLSNGYRHLDQMVIVKYANDLENNFGPLHEYVVGKILNSLRRETFTFVYTYAFTSCGAVLARRLKQGDSYTLCEGKQKVNHLFLEYVIGKPLEALLATREIPPDDLGKVYLIVFLSLSLAYNKYKFVHNDLHAENIMIRSLKRPISHIFEWQGRQVIVNTRFSPAIIDFGFARIEKDGIIYHKEGFEDLPFIRQAYPVIDFFKLISHSIYSGSSVYRSLFEKVVSSVNFLDPRDLTTLQQLTRGQPSGVEDRFFYPQGQLSSVVPARFVEMFLSFADSRIISQPIAYTSNQLRESLYGLDEKGNYLHAPCNGENNPSRDIYGLFRRVFDCAKYYFDGRLNVVEFAPGIQLYHGNPDMVAANHEFPFGKNFYSSEESPPLFFLTELDDARINSATSSGPRCGRNCTFAYRTKETLRMVDLTDPFNLYHLSKEVPLDLAFQIALTNGAPLPSGGVGNTDDEKLRSFLIAIGQSDPTLVEKVRRTVEAWQKDFQERSEKPGGFLAGYHPIRKISNPNLVRKSYTFDNFRLGRKLMDYFESSGYHGYVNLPTPQLDGMRNAEFAFRKHAPRLLARDLSNPYDWQYQDDRYLFGALGELIRDLRLYKTTKTDTHAGDLLEHSVWSALYTQMMFRDNHWAVSGLGPWRSFLIAASFLHDLGKGGDRVFLYSDKPNHALRGAEMIEKGEYRGEKGVINLNQLFQQMEVGSDLIPLLAFLIRHHPSLGKQVSECGEVNAECAQKVWSWFLSILGSSFPDQSRNKIFQSLLVVWIADVMASQPYLARDKLQLLSEKVAKNPREAGFYFNEALDGIPAISNMPQVHRGKNLFVLVENKAEKLWSLLREQKEEVKPPPLDLERRRRGREEQPRPLRELISPMRMEIPVGFDNNVPWRRRFD